MTTRSSAVVALPAAPAWWGLSAIGVGVFFALAVVGHPVGLGLTVALLGVLATGVAVTPARDRWTLAWWSLAAVLALMPTLRTAGWVVALSVLGTLALAVAAAGRSVTWARAFAAPGRWLLMLVPAPLVVIALAGRGTSNAVVRGLIGATLLVGLFGTLFSAADATFGSLSSEVVPELDHGQARIALALLAVAVSGALALVAAMPAAEPAPAPAPVLGSTESRIALGALVALFALFVGVQAATLFGGDGFVQRTAGVTYAQYARSGFALLLVVAALALGVVAAAARWARADRVLLGALCVLTVVILASAWHRLGLYTDAYGATRAREFAGWSIAWLAGLFALVLVRRGVPRAVITWSAILGVAFGASSPDARIAAGSADRAYVRTLSDDAAGVTGRCVARDGGLWSVTLAELRYGCEDASS